MKFVLMILSFLLAFCAYAKELSAVDKSLLVFDMIKMNLFPRDGVDMSTVLSSLSLQKGFKITLYAADVKGARSLALGDNGVVFVGSRDVGKVYAILPKTKAHAKKVIVIAENLNIPNGVGYIDGDLYVAENQRILKFKKVMAQLSTGKVRAKVIYDKLPSELYHGWRYLTVGPDKKLYVSIGAPCNICLKKNKRFASILRVNRDGKHPQIIAHGVRNSLGLAFHPTTDRLWFTDNGRDWLGDSLPPDELNVLTAIGQNFGFPFVYGDNHPDIFYKQRPTVQLIEPNYLLKAHVSPLGLRFYDKESYPSGYQGNLFVALHGSWNSTKKVGYKIKRFVLDEQTIVIAEDFVWGWLKGNEVLGRPVDLLVMPDGSMLISDDYNGVIYRVAYEMK